MQPAASATESYGLLSAWFGIHASGAYILLCLLGTDLQREWQQEGWVAAQHLLALLVVNTILYTCLVKVTAGHCSQLNTATRSAATSSSLLTPNGNRSSASIITNKQLRVSSSHGVVCVTVLACSNDDRTTEPEQLTILGSQRAEGINESRNSSRQCSCPNRHANRAHHCCTCNACVMGFDHHCHWLGGDVAQHNHGLFYLYLTSQNSVCLYALYQALNAVRNAAHAGTAWSSGWQYAAIVGFALLLLVAALLLSSLLAFHTFLILGNWKTHEVLRAPKNCPASLQGTAQLLGCRSPYDRGIVQNVHNFVCDRQLYDTPADSWQLPDEAGGGAPGSWWHNSVYSCC